MLEGADIKDHFERIRPRLEKIRARFGYSWTPEDVRDQCVTGKAHLFLHSDYPDGFLVLKATEDDWTKEGILDVWIAYSGGKKTKQDFWQLEELARAIGAKKIRMESQRIGFKRAGWQVRGILFERSVS